MKYHLLMHGTVRLYALIMMLMLVQYGFIAASAATLPIATGSKSGVYHAVGNVIQETLQGRFTSRIEALETQGSLDNIKLLSEDKAFFAILQSDILYQIYDAGKKSPKYALKPELKKLRGIAALYPEYTQILVRSNHVFSQMINLSGKKIYAGLPHSGSRQNATDILTSAGIPQPTFVDTEDLNSVDDALRALIAGNLDAVIVTTGELMTKRPEFAGRIKLVPLEIHLQDEIKKIHPYYSFTEIDTGTGTKTPIMFTRAVLVMKQEDAAIQLPSESVYSLSEVLYKEFQLEIAKKLDGRVDAFRPELMARGFLGSPVELHSAAEDCYLRQGALLDTSWIQFTVGFLTVCVALILLFNLGSSWSWVAACRFWMTREDSNLRQPFQWVRWGFSNPIPVTLWILSWLLLVDVLAIISVENHYALTADTPNHFADRSLPELLTWLVTFATTGFPQDLFPLSTPGKIAAAIIPLIGFGSVIFLLIYGNFKRNQRAELEERGVTVPPLKDHIIICGWNDRMPDLVNELIATTPWSKPAKVVVIMESEKEKPLLQYKYRPGAVFFRNGISSDFSNLKDASIEGARGAIIAADPRKVEHENLRSVFTCVALRELRPELSNFRIVAERHFNFNEHRFRNARVSKQIPLSYLTARLMSHACMNPGISDIITEILSFRTAQITQLIPANDEKACRCVATNITFRELLEKFREQDSQLLAIYRHGVIDMHEDSELEFHEQTPYLVSPFRPEDLKYVVKEQDKLLVLRPSGITQKPPSIQKNLGGNIESARYCPASESLLIIGDDTYAREFAKEMRNHCVDIIMFGPSEFAEENCQEDVSAYGVKKWFAIEEINNLHKIIETHPSLFHAITRVVVFSAEKHASEHTSDEYIDDQTMARAMKVMESFCSKTQKHIPIIAEMRCEKNRRLFEKINITQSVPVNRLITLTMANMIQHGGLVSEFFLKSMDISSSNRHCVIQKLFISSLQESIRFAVIGKTFDQAMMLLFDHHRLQLLAIVKKGGVIIINPPKASEEYKKTIADADYIFILGNPAKIAEAIDAKVCPTTTPS